jgi:hypothetical protein
LFFFVLLLVAKKILFSLKQQLLLIQENQLPQLIQRTLTRLQQISKVSKAAPIIAVTVVLPLIMGIIQGTSGLLASIDFNVH